MVPPRWLMGPPGRKFLPDVANNDAADRRRLERRQLLWIFLRPMWKGGIGFVRWTTAR
jgi:hypothetical protein